MSSLNGVPNALFVDPRLLVALILCVMFFLLYIIYNANNKKEGT